MFVTTTASTVAGIGITAAFDEAGLRYWQVALGSSRTLADILTGLGMGSLASVDTSGFVITDSRVVVVAAAPGKPSEPWCRKRSDFARRWAFPPHHPLVPNLHATTPSPPHFTYSFHGPERHHVGSRNSCRPDGVGASPEPHCHQRVRGSHQAGWHQGHRRVDRCALEGLWA